MRPLEKPQGLIKLPIKQRRKQDSSSWALSYGDMVTALLCFFIIFYAMEKQFEKAKNPVKGYAETEGILQEHKSSEVDTEYEYAIENLQKIPGIEVMKTSAFVDITFKKIVFFKKGKTELTVHGRELLDSVVSKLTKIEGKYILEIQGHSDSIPVIKRRDRWWSSNMQLSVLRALSVHAYLTESYIEKNHLVVSGYGNLRKIATAPEESESNNRRVSLRLQLVK